MTTVGSCPTGLGPSSGTPKLKIIKVSHKQISHFLQIISNPSRSSTTKVFFTYTSTAHAGLKVVLNSHPFVNVLEYSDEQNSLKRLA